MSEPVRDRGSRAEWASVIVAVAALAVAILSIVVSLEANDSADDANYISRQANDKSDDANDIARQANEIAEAAIEQEAQNQQDIVELERQINLDPGELIVYPPTDFCILRGYRSFPSDHIVIPITFENTGNGAKTFSNATLFFEDPNTGTQRRFFLAGYFQGFNIDVFGNRYEIATGITVPQRSVARYVLVFHIEQWWNEASDDFIFRFIPGSSIDTQLGYFLSENNQLIYWQHENDRVFFTLPVYPALARLRLSQTMIDNLLRTEDVRANPELVTFLQSQESGMENARCFTFDKFPDFPQE